MKFGLDFIMKLKPCSWRFKSGPLSDGKEHLGLIAQDVNEIVDQKKYAFVVFKGKYYAINYHEFIGPLIKSVQELSEKVDKLEQEKVRKTKTISVETLSKMKKKDRRILLKQIRENKVPEKYIEKE